MNTEKTVVVGLSGGVDSAVAALRLLQQGCRVIGATMKIWDGDQLAAAATGRHACYGPDEAQDIADARAVAGALGIEFHVVDLAEDYRRTVLDPFIAEYRSGRTPNPCVRCNRVMKFRLLPQRLRDSGLTFDYFATGHYVRRHWDEWRQCWTLRQAIDGSKDQSYFLYFLDQELLQRSVFPLGELRKLEVRQLANRYGLPVAEKVESQDFARGGHQSLLAGVAQPGPILDRGGRELGRHSGIVYYTVGQRHGLGIARAEPLYVLAKDERRQALIVGGRNDLFCSEMTVSGVHWVMPGSVSTAFHARVKIRHGAPAVDASCMTLGDGRVAVRFAEPQWAVAPGQSAVFYQGGEVLGGGDIDG